ncbi:hypothetical protein N6G95_01680 [Pediococcus inopinatus]|uniref:hypothetical protein n=1 Tax=Pediococcus inopinatus TaxID=114090 RepID=UPI000A6B8533|nr:hypothetical protein [Pediococcus inopinatus]WPC19931.1 hypothetical protein N6G95_01680 [Pediococcus inopinatus]
MTKVTYRIVLTNPRKTVQRIQIVQTLKYKLAPNPLKTNGVSQTYSSLIYTFSTKA